MAVAAASLLERDAELDDLRALLAGVAAGRGALVLVQGPAGIGKTALVRRLREDATAQAVRVLAATGAELERDFAFGVVQQLLGGVLRGAAPEERRALLAGSAAAAEAVFDARVAPAPAHATLHGLYWLVADLAERAPLALVVDDAHWADEASLRFLEFLARRVEDLPVLLVVAERPAEADAGPAAATLSGLAAMPGARFVAPAPLSARAVRALLAGALDAEPEDALVRAAVEASGGNPLLVAELARELARRGSRGAAQDAALARTAVSGSLVRTVAARLHRLGPDAAEVAQAVAVLGERVRTDRVARMTRRPAVAVDAALDALVRAAVLADATIAFAHPLLREAVLADLTSIARRRLHHLAADVLRADGEDEDLVAAHLLAADPAGDPATAELLLRAGERAFADGAPELARRLLARGLAEPPPPAGRPALLLGLGRAELATGRTADALHRLERAIAEGDPVIAARAELARAAAAREAGHHREVAAGLQAALDALDALGDADPALSLALTERLVETQLFVPELVPARAARLEALDPRGAPPALLSHLAFHRAVTFAPKADVVAVAQRAWAGGELLEGFHWGRGSPYWVNEALCSVEAAEEAFAFVAAAGRAAARSGSAPAIAYAEACRAHAEWRFGDLRHAEEHTRAALATLRELRLPSVDGLCLASLAQIRLDRGDVAHAAALLDEVPATSDAARLGALEAIRGRVELAQGRPEHALRSVERQWALEREHGLRITPREHSRALNVAALAAAGRREDALAAAAAALANVHGRGMGGVTAALLLARSRAEDPPTALATLEEAARAAASAPLRLVRARAMTEWGTALRRAGRRREARERLREGRALAHAIGADGVERQAFDELQIAGARPQRIALAGRAALTASELRTAELAAQGLTNREIAEQLFVTVKTVEVHLGRAYSKLDIRSRGQLPAALADEESGQD